MNQNQLPGPPSLPIVEAGVDVAGERRILLVRGRWATYRRGSVGGAWARTSRAVGSGDGVQMSSSALSEVMVFAPRLQPVPGNSHERLKFASRESHDQDFAVQDHHAAFHSA